MRILYLASYGLGNAIEKTPAIKALHEAGHSVYVIADSGPLGFSDWDGLLGDWPCISSLRTFDYTKERTGDDLISYVYHEVKPDLCVQSYPGDELFSFLLPYLKCDVRRAPKTRYDIHEVEVNLDMVKDLVAENPARLYEIPPRQSDRIDEIFASIPAGKKVVALCPSYKKEGVWWRKHWGNRNYALLANMLQATGHQVVLLDGADGISTCNFISYVEPDVINLAGLTSIRETVAALSRCDAVIANDCGPAHLAAALSKPLLVFFGPTSVEKNRPWGPQTIVLKTSLDCEGKQGTSSWGKCKNPLCGNQSACISAINPPMVMGALQRHIFNAEGVS